MNIGVTVSLFVIDDLSIIMMAGEKTTRELIYETNRDVKWICKTLQRMEARDEDFEGRLRALEGWRAEKAGFSDQRRGRRGRGWGGGGDSPGDRRGVEGHAAL